MSEIEIIAMVEGTNVIPEGWPERHKLYFRDGNSWVYLTSKGYELYDKHKEEVDELIQSMYEPKLKHWSKAAVEEVLNV